MIVLHASQTEIGLLLWGEQAVDSLPKGKSNIRGAKRHPFEADLDILSDALGEHGQIDAEQLTHLDALAWLPSQGDLPLPSTPMLIDQELPTGTPVVSAWLTSALFIEPVQAVALLCTCLGKKMLAPGLILGHDLIYWTRAIRFAGAIVARQEYLPGIRAIGEEYHAVWEPTVNAQSKELLATFAKAMPHAARALTNPTSPKAPQTSAASVLRSFLTDSVDALVRSRVPMHDRQKSSAQKSSFESIHDAWLDALLTADGAIAWKAKEIESLEAAISRWRRPINLADSSPVRLCFRLEEPGSNLADSPTRNKNDSELWRVSYLLQPHEDKSLQIPLSSLWEPKGLKPAIRRCIGSRAQEYVLSSLGQAAGLCPNISDSLKSRSPNGYYLDDRGAYEFLSQRSLALEQAGFGVLLPSWWTRSGTKLRPVVGAKVKTPDMKASAGLSLDTIVQFDWEVSLGDERLSFKELMALAKLKAPLVKIRGQWVEVNAHEIKAAIDFWKKKESSHATVRDIVRMSLGAQDSEFGLEFTGVNASGWIDDFLSQLNGQSKYTEIPPPPSFNGTLRPYQHRGFSWLSFLREWGLGACLADDMGLGKTIQTLVLIQKEWEDGKTQPTLLVCPTTVVNNWVKEAAKFTPNLPVMVHHGIGRKKDTAFKKAAAEHAIVISSYGLLQRDLKLLMDIPWAGVVLDEAQNVKNPETKQAKAARAIPSGFRIALTGTPVENNVGDLWSIMEFLNPGLLSTQADFRRRFFMPIQAGGDQEAAARLRRITGPFILRRLKTDPTIISDLPDKVEGKEYCSLTKEQASLYAAVLKDLEKSFDEAEGIQRRGIILATLSKLKQVCNHPAHFLGDNSSIPDRSGKLSRLTEMLEEVFEAGDKALVFTQFTEMGEILKRHFQETFGQEALFLHGGVTKSKRDKMVERFQSIKDSPPLFILSLKAGGTGLNLINANHVFHFDRWWNPAVENQATDRAFRIGQKRNVMVHKYICSGTLEEKIDDLIERKKGVAEQVVGAGEAWLTELSNEAFREIIALRPEALGE